MPLLSLPPVWRTAVCAALERSPDWKDSGWQRCLLEFPNNFPSEFLPVVARFLKSSDPKGCAVQMDSPPGETYEFFFEFEGSKIYGKILLRTDRKRILIYSMHRPTGPRLRCE
jgi:hypothetical protein